MLNPEQSRRDFSVEKAIHDAGMSARPEFYSGRGATLSDLNSEILGKIHGAIRKALGNEAAQSFVQMIVDTPVLSATDFLLNLQRLQRAGWKWSKALCGDEQGISITNEATAFATVVHALFDRGRVDETEAIRGLFLEKQGIKAKTSKANRRSVWGNEW